MITVESVTKTYGRFGRRTRALDGVSLEVRRGETLGLIGPNGAGKTTLLSCLLGFLRPDSGRLSVEGRAVDDLWVRARTGYMPERLGLDRDLSGASFLSVHWRLSGGDPARERVEIAAAAERVGLDRSALGKKLRTYSRGMLQRIGMAQALVQSPSLLVLDEPTAGVDPLGSRDIRNIIENLKGRGMTVFLCSHLLEQVQEVCDRVGVIFKGLLIAEGSVNELTRDSDKQEILLEHASPELMERLKEMVKEDGRAVWLEDGHPRNSLESVFLKSLLEWKEKHPNPEP